MFLPRKCNFFWNIDLQCWVSNFQILIDESFKGFHDTNIFQLDHSESREPRTLCQAFILGLGSLPPIWADQLHREIVFENGHCIQGCGGACEDWSFLGHEHFQDDQFPRAVTWQCGMAVLEDFQTMLIIPIMQDCLHTHTHTYRLRDHKLLITDWLLGLSYEGMWRNDDPSIQELKVSWLCLGAELLVSLVSCDQ